MTSPAFFANAADHDVLGFGVGPDLNPKAVADWLGLEKTDVSRLADIPVKSVRWGETMPEAVRERLEEIATTCNLVAKAFDGNVIKTALWFKAKNPMLGDVSPRDMVRLGRLDRLRKFVLSSLTEDSDARHHRSAAP